uniref:Uncharacterized protein n=1 Tax=Tetraselmis sp. GSL018 TaxID=582737 RepID=A0A061S6K0_9CHLO|mmetsp:Transcript_11116/g.26374  ORF Transcript_11116/g.26374 Transcript_11116/m.26374 type:complete len:318 (-) Transcript_11116:279-1232(-)|eukprot:CAMPEP_0177602896 /NCGR_PEP_ID=MMETSP0419_2-20121207/15173_1 /TAXON_ID=582737 /ORGANISM="Tetraselmis sp., Strain GSL018" /LENGTH=317 /DNA_ID=CAMNT_0019096531 /DNA_START=363 /DNA_END=1316 /DNA_ORIENTATION=-
MDWNCKTSESLDCSQGVSGTWSSSTPTYLQLGHSALCFDATVNGFDNFPYDSDSLEKGSPRKPASGICTSPPKLKRLHRQNKKSQKSLGVIPLIRCKRNLSKAFAFEAPKLSPPKVKSSPTVVSDMVSPTPAAEVTQESDSSTLQSYREEKLMQPDLPQVTFGDNSDITLSPERFDQRTKFEFPVVDRSATSSQATVASKPCVSTCTNRYHNVARNLFGASLQEDSSAVSGQEEFTATCTQRVRADKPSSSAGSDCLGQKKPKIWDGSNGNYNSNLDRMDMMTPKYHEHLEDGLLTPQVTCAPSSNYRQQSSLRHMR